MLAGPGMRAQEIANLAWALAVMGEADVDLLKDLLRSAQAQSKDITLIESHQLYQVWWCGEFFDGMHAWSGRLFSGISASCIL